MPYFKGSYDQLGGDPGVDAALTGEIIYLDIYISIYLLGKWTSGIFSLGYCQFNWR